MHSITNVMLSKKVKTLLYCTKNMFATFVRLVVTLISIDKCTKSFKMFSLCVFIF